MNYVMLTTRARRYTQQPVPPPVAPQWDISQMVQASSTGAPILNAQGIWFKGDGARMYVVASGQPAQVVEQSLAVPWDTSAARTTLFTLTLPVAFSTGISLSSDGGNAYVLTSSDGSSWSVSRYTMASQWTLSTASFAESLQTHQTATGVALSTAGDILYVVERQSGSIHQYALPTPWSLQSATASGSFSLAGFGSDTNGPEDVFIRNDGVMMYVSFRGTTVDARIVQFGMETPWDVSTLKHIRTYSSQSLEPPLGLHFKPDGSRAFVANSFLKSFDFVAAGEITITEHPVSVFSETGAATFSADATVNNGATISYAWERAAAGSTAWQTLTGQTAKTLSVSGRTAANDGERYRVVASAPNAGSVVSNEATLQIGGFGFLAGSFSVLSQDGAPAGVAIGNSGMNLYIVGSLGDDINEYSLSTPWSVATASFTRSQSVAAQEGFPTGVSFSTTGDLMFVCGYNEDRVHAYTLATPWNISTATATASVSVAAKFSLPRGVAFSPDGSRMFVVGSGSVNGVARYNLSMPWDITSASHAEDYSVAGYENTPSGVVFSSNGSRMLVAGIAGQAVYDHTLATPWSIATATLTKTSTLLAVNHDPFGIAASPTLDRVFVTGSNNSSVYQYKIQPTT